MAEVLSMPGMKERSKLMRPLLKLCCSVWRLVFGILRGE